MAAGASSNRLGVISSLAQITSLFVYKCEGHLRRDDTVVVCLRQLHGAMPRRDSTVGKACAPTGQTEGALATHARVMTTVVHTMNLVHVGPI
jgi:hypothetical protein